MTCRHEISKHEDELATENNHLRTVNAKLAEAIEELMDFIGELDGTVYREFVTGKGMQIMAKLNTARKQDEIKGGA